MHAIAGHIQARPSLELKTRPRFHLVSLRLSMLRFSWATKVRCLSNVMVLSEMKLEFPDVKG